MEIQQSVRRMRSELARQRDEVQEFIDKAPKHDSTVDYAAGSRSILDEVLKIIDAMPFKFDDDRPDTDEILKYCRSEAERINLALAEADGNDGPGYGSFRAAGKIDGLQAVIKYIEGETAETVHPVNGTHPTHPMIGITVDGGVITDVFTDCPHLMDVQVMVIDYDAEGGPEELWVMVRQPGDSEGNQPPDRTAFVSVREMESCQLPAWREMA